MSNPTTIAGKLVPLAISTDNITFKNAVCLKTWNLDLDIPTNDEPTQCGVFRTESPQTCQFDFELVVNTTPTTGTEISYKELLGYWSAATSLYVKVAPGTGITVSSYGKIYNLKSSAPVNGLLTVTATFKNNGADPVIS
jgi:hypothetical protein